MYSIYLKKTTFRGNFEKYSKARHFTAKGCQITKCCEAIDLNEPWKSALKKVFFHKMFDESHINRGKMKILKIALYKFNGSSVKWTNLVQFILGKKVNLKNYYYETFLPYF